MPYVTTTVRVELHLFGPSLAALPPDVCFIDFAVIPLSARDLPVLKCAPGVATHACLELYLSTLIDQLRLVIRKHYEHRLATKVKIGQDKVRFEMDSCLSHLSGGFDALLHEDGISIDVRIVVVPGVTFHGHAPSVMLCLTSTQGGFIHRGETVVSWPRELATLKVPGFRKLPTMRYSSYDGKSGLAAFLVLLSEEINQNIEIECVEPQRRQKVVELLLQEVGGVLEFDQTSYYDIAFEIIVEGHPFAVHLSMRVVPYIVVVTSVLATYPGTTTPMSVRLALEGHQGGLTAEAVIKLLRAHVQKFTAKINSLKS